MTELETTTVIGIPEACRSIISRAFSPKVSVVASDDVQELCKDMGFDSLLDILKPFGDKIAGRVTVCDSQAISVSFDDFSIRFTGACDTDSIGSAGQLPQLFSNEDLEAYIFNELSKLTIDITPEISEEIYLDFFKRILSSSSETTVPFETFSHPVTGVIAVSSRNEHPIETLSALFKRTHDPEIPDYINKDYLRYYILVHDEQSDNLDKSVTLFEKMKRHFGMHCHMIRINKQTDQNNTFSNEVEMTEVTGEEPTTIKGTDHAINNDNANDNDNDVDSDYIILNETEWKTVTQLVQTEQEESVEHPSSIRRRRQRQKRSLHASDFNAIQIFVRELVVQSVLPFMERCIATWNDQVASSRRGLTGRFFSASKKYFASSTRATSSILSTASGASPFPFSLGGTTPTLIGSSAPASRSSTPPTSSTSSNNSSNSALRNNNTNYNNSSKYSYNYLSPEAQIRKLADFAFMLRDYKFAYTTYDLLKRDYHNDKAWSYLAASQEMAAISYLMTSEILPPQSRIDVIDSLLDSATYSYISRCLLPSYALRCIMISSELLCTVHTPSAASEGATKWILKALNERLVGRLGYAMLMERISGAYSAYDDIVTKHQYLSPSPSPSPSQSKSQSPAPVPVYQRPQQQANNPSRSSTPASTTSTISSTNSNKISIGSRRTSRSRKAAFWQLLAAREWHDANMNNKALYCVDQANMAMYKDLEWAQNPTDLLGRLLES